MGWVGWLDWISLGGVKYRAPTVLSKIPSEGGSLLLLVELFGNTCSPFNLIVRLISSILGTLTPACLPGKSALYKSFLLQLPRWWSQCHHWWWLLSSLVMIMMSSLVMMMQSSLKMVMMSSLVMDPGNHFKNVLPLYDHVNICSGWSLIMVVIIL